MPSKTLKKELEKKRQQVGIIQAIRLSAKELTVIQAMMKDEDWTNVSGFIKYKVFGFTPETAYKKLLDSGKPEDFINVLTNQLDTLNRNIDYINFRFDQELLEFKKKINSKEFDEKDRAKWMALLSGWTTRLQEKNEEIFCDCQAILKAINVNVERKDYKDITMVPDYVIEKAGRDWNDNYSPEAQEHQRRVIEKFRQKHPEYIRENEPSKK